MLAIVVKTAILITLVASATGSAIACVCVSNPLSQRFREASAVFIGQAVNDEYGRPEEPMLFQQNVAVLKAWKGIRQKYITVIFRDVDFGSSCSILYYFEPGKRYLIFAYGKKFEVIAVCSDTLAIPDSRDAPGYEHDRIKQ